jgi:hypothetical protein
MKEFENINQILNDYFNEIKNLNNFDINKYAEKIKKIREIASIIYIEGQSYFKNIDFVQIPSKKISFDETIELVSDYLKTIDSSFLKDFLKALKEGVINFTTKEEIETMKGETDYLFTQNLAGILNNKYFINIVLEENISDAFTLVHEFSHYHNMAGDDKLPVCYNLFTEGYAQTFETDFYFYLLKNKKYESEASNYYETLLLSILNRSSNFISEYSILDTFLTYQKISNQTIYKTFKDYENPKTGFKMEIEAIKILLEKLKNPTNLFLDDGPYVIALPFSFEVSSEAKRDKDKFMLEYENLGKGNVDYYYKKYIKNASLEGLYRNGCNNK